MINLITETSKYLMILLIAFYTFFNFRFFSLPDLKRKRVICARQNQAMFLMHLLAYLIIYLKTGELRVLVFYAAQVIFFLAYIYLYRLLYRNVSRLLVNNACMLFVRGTDYAYPDFPKPGNSPVCDYCSLGSDYLAGSVDDCACMAVK